MLWPFPIEQHVHFETCFVLSYVSQFPTREPLEYRHGARRAGHAMLDHERAAAEEEGPPVLALALLGEFGQAE
jgi:hypothetical protein